MNYSSKKFLGDKPYVGYEEYLEDLFIYIVVYLRDYIRSAEGYLQNNVSYGNTLLPSYQEVLHYLEQTMQSRDLDLDQELQDWYKNMVNRRVLSEIIGDPYPIEQIAHRLELDNFSVFSVLLSLFASINTEFQRVIRFLQKESGSSYPTLELCVRLYLEKQKASEYEKNRLIYTCSEKLKLLYPLLGKEKQTSHGELSCDERLLDLLFGQERFLTKGVHLESSQTEEPNLFRDKELNQLKDFIPAEFPLTILCGERGAGKKHLVKHFAKEFCTNVVFLDLKSYTEEGSVDLEQAMEAVSYAGRESILKQLPLAITGVENLRTSEMEQFVTAVQTGIKKEIKCVFLLVESEKYSTGIEGLYVLELKCLTQLQLLELWKHYTKDFLLEENCNLDSLANTFLITPGQILSALKQASLFSGGNKNLISEKLLYEACYAQLNHKLAEKTSKVNASFTWEDLKLPDSDKDILKDICNCVKNKHIVLNEWNFSKVIPYGAGLTVLFSGPPGTGKTMAAQVIANELHMELYKIDLSQLFDKYVGETEKNIKQIFSLAQRSNSILFFDEADAIFNKRLEASTSNDRYANIESSLLLQCIEEYSGISILATNNFNSIDAAFIRRFKYYLLFREPDEQVRYEIWKSVIPKEAPVSPDVDLRILARQFEFTGAVIKNVILSAAYLAAEKKEAISIIDILISVKRELFKNNLTLTKDKLGSLGYLFEDIK